MTSILIIDGYNAIHALPALSSRLHQGLESAREELLKMARAWRSRHAVWEVLIVFDGQDAEAGHRGREVAPGVKSVFTSSNEEADDRIKQIVRKQGARAQMIVITRDREILNCCRAHGVRIESPEFLLEKSAFPKSRAVVKSETLAEKDKKEISDWYRDALKAKGKL